MSKQFFFFNVTESTQYDSHSINNMTIMRMTDNKRRRIGRDRKSLGTGCRGVSHLP